MLKFIEYYDLYEEIIWDQNLNFFVICNDVFAWACADCEEIQSKDLPDLKQAIEDADYYGPTLWSVRKRGQNPQKPLLDRLPENIRHLFMVE